MNTYTEQQKTAIDLVRGWYNGLTPSIADYGEFLLNCVELQDSERSEGGGEWDIPTEREFSNAVEELLAA